MADNSDVHSVKRGVAAIVAIGSLLGLIFGSAYISSHNSQIPAVTTQATPTPATRSDTVAEEPTPDNNYSDETDYSSYGEASAADIDDDSDACNPNYDPCVPDADYDLDCGDIGEEVTVTGDDEYNLDRDGDGYGCESYR